MSECTDGGRGAELHVVSKVTTAIPSYGCDVDLERQEVEVGRDRAAGGKGGKLNEGRREAGRQTVGEIHTTDREAGRRGG